MFNTYNLGMPTMVHKTSILTAIKETPEVKIDADPLIKDLCEWVCNETKGATVFSCEGHTRPYAYGYIEVVFPDIDIDKVLEVFAQAKSEILTPVQAKKQMSVTADIWVEYATEGIGLGTFFAGIDYRPNNFTFRFRYKQNDKRFSLHIFNRVMKQVIATIDTLDMSPEAYVVDGQSLGYPVKSLDFVWS